MSGNWFRSWFTRRPASAPAPQPQVQASGAGLASPHAERESARAGATPPQVSLATLSAEVADRVTALLSDLPEPLRRTDASEVLGAIVTTTDTIVRQPASAAQMALVVTRNADSTTSDLVRLFNGDPGLAQALLRHANSAYYSGLGASCTSLPHAVQRIGITGVENVLLTHMVQTTLCRPGGRYDALVEQVWSHMVRTAPIARDLARRFDVVPDEGFALGLLHDAGKLVLFDALSTFRREKRRDSDLPHHLVLWALKRLHEPLGGLAALRWGMSEAAARAIAAHHRQPPPAAPDRASELLFVAERVDLAETRGHALDLDVICEIGQLGVTPDALREALEMRRAA